MLRLKEKYDVAVIGGGPGGYVAAIRLAQYGKKVVLFEANNLGGTCLNVGCIPSKSLLRSAEIVETIKRSEEFGVMSKGFNIDYKVIKSRKDEIVNQLVTGVGYLLKKNNITIKNEYVESIEQSEVLTKENRYDVSQIILATGSKPFVPKIAGIDEIEFDTTDTIFQWTELPDKMVIIGGGVIGVEMAQAFASFDVEVTVVEVAEEILLTEDKAARDLVRNHLKDQGVHIIEHASIKKIEKGMLKLQDKTIPFDKVLIATGRKNNLELAKKLNVALSENQKFVEVNENMQTSIKHIYAIGDIIPGLQLAHAASHEGSIAAAHICKEPFKAGDSNAVPRCVYTTPEIASFGMDLETALNQGFDAHVYQYDLSGNGKAMAYGDTQGFVKIISEQKYGEILGAVICGPHATELISTILAVKESEGTVFEMKDQIFAHPTVSESIGEASLDYFDLAIHKP